MSDKKPTLPLPGQERVQKSQEEAINDRKLEGMRLIIHHTKEIRKAKKVYLESLKGLQDTLAHHPNLREWYEKTCDEIGEEPVSKKRKLESYPFLFDFGPEQKKPKKDEDEPPAQGGMELVK